MVVLHCTVRELATATTLARSLKSVYVVLHCAVQVGDCNNTGHALEMRIRSSQMYSMSWRLQLHSPDPGKKHLRSYTLVYSTCWRLQLHSPDPEKSVYVVLHCAVQVGNFNNAGHSLGKRIRSSPMYCTS